jgi:hypothetical protein
MSSMTQHANKKLGDIFYFGYGVLIFAIIINGLGRYLGMKSWHDLFGSTHFFDLGLIDMVWLIVAYPFSLGLGVYVLNKYKTRRG